MLPSYWRLRASNTQNQSVTVTVKAKPWKFNSSGQIVFGSEVTLISASSLAASTGTGVSSAQNNDTSGAYWLGLHLTASYQAGAATNGTGAVVLTIEASTDAGTTWPTAGNGFNPRAPD